MVTDFKLILAKANEPKVDAKIPMSTRFHDLRHSAASLLLAQGVQLRAIMELLGHSTIALTANTYSHVMPSMMQEMPRRWMRFSAREAAQFARGCQTWRSGNHEGQPTPFFLS